MPDQLRINDDIVESLRQSIFYGGNSLKDVPALIKQVLSEEMWRERIIVKTGELVKFDRFEQFVVSPPLKGLGATMDIVRSIVRDDVGALDLLDRSLQTRPGPRESFDNIKELDPPPTGTSAASALRRLRKDAPELHAKVIAGDISPHGAMVQAGFRKRATPLDQAKRAWTKMGNEDRQTFLLWTTGGDS